MDAIPTMKTSSSFHAILTSFMAIYVDYITIPSCQRNIFFYSYV